MKRLFVSTFVFVLFALTACAQTATPPPENPTATPPSAPTQQPTTPPAETPTEESSQATSSLDTAIESIGGADALESLSSFVIETDIRRYTTGEGPEPNFEPDPPISISANLSFDVEGGNLRLDYIREGEGLASTYSEVIKGDLGYMIGRDARFGGSEGSNITSDRLASSLKQQRLLNPHLILKDAMDNPSMASDGGVEDLDGVEHGVLKIADDVFPITLFVDSETGTISRLSTMETDHWLRDVTLEVFYIDWQTRDSGVMFPNHVAIALDGTVVHDETRSDVQLNASIDDSMFEFPEGAEPSFDAELASLGESSSQSIQMFSARGFPQPLGLTSISPNEVAPGIFHLGGSSHNSLVVEQENGIVIAEAPLYPERSEAVIAWVEEQFPEKPITHVILSHHHRDHSSGLRAYVARGITVVMNERAEGVFREIFSRPSTIVPDALEENPAEPVIETVPNDGMFEIPDSERTVTVVSIASGHASDTVFTHAAGGDVVFMGDGGAQTPELIAALEEFDLEASTFAGGHGQASPFE